LKVLSAIIVLVLLMGAPLLFLKDSYLIVFRGEDIPWLQAFWPMVSIVVVFLWFMFFMTILVKSGFMRWIDEE